VSEVHSKATGIWRSAHGVWKYVLGARRPVDRAILDDTPELYLETKNEFNLSCFVSYPSS